MPIDSDAAGADEFLDVTFYEKDYEKQKVDFCRIIAPGMAKEHIWDQPVREADKARFPKKWLFYQMKKTGQAGGESFVFGTPLAELAASIKDEALQYQLAELQILKFQSIEQVANMSDLQAQKIGMGAIGLRGIARSYLSSRGQGVQGEELTRTKGELDILKTQMAALIERMNAQPVMAAPVMPKRRGPKPGYKKKVLVDVEHDAPTGDAGNG